jgi:midasin
MNLRDLSRWFQLLDSTPGTKPWHFLDIAISNRFRTPEDKVLVDGLYAEVFGEKPGVKSYFHNLGPESYQVGLGVLSRNFVVQRLASLHMNIVPADLHIMESIALCLARAWPVILAGPSGSGKTTTLRKVAALAGVKLVEISLNSDTDAMDLIGGFEQKDLQRQLSAFLDDLACWIQHHLIVGHTVPDASDSSEAVQLYHLLQEESHQLEPVLASLQSLSHKFPETDFPTFYEECSSLYRASKVKGELGFEWTEGLLVHAIQRGDWVVLDNANLCNASVLDRLNSLLEPDGYLVINEQRTADGSTRTVKPHPSFRIFLTMDPRHGELSRAMRNRAVEISLSKNADAQFSPNAPVTYLSEAAIYRLRQLVNFSSIDTATMGFPEFLATALDHLSPYDVTQAQDFLESIMHELPAESRALFSSIVTPYRSLLGESALIGLPNSTAIERLDRNSKFLDCWQVIEVMSLSTGHILWSSPC